MEKEKKESPSVTVEAALEETIEEGFDFLQSVDTDRAKVVFLLGVLIYFILSFIHYGKVAAIKSLESQIAQLYVKYPEPLKPAPPTPPLEPSPEWFVGGESSEEYIAAKKRAEQATKEYLKKLEEYRTKILPKWKKEHAEWEHKLNQLLVKEKPLLEAKLKEKKAHLHAWAYLFHIFRFFAAFLMAFGCTALLFHGNPYEQAVSLFILGYVLLGLFGIDKILLP